MDLLLLDLRGEGCRYTFRERMLWLCRQLKGADLILSQVDESVIYDAGYKDRKVFGASIPGGLSKGKNPDIFVRMGKGRYRWTKAFKLEAEIFDAEIEEFYQNLVLQERMALECLMTEQLLINGSRSFRLKTANFPLDEIHVIAFMEKLVQFRVIQIIGSNKNGLQQRVWELNQPRFQRLIDLHRHLVAESASAFEAPTEAGSLPDLSSEESAQSQIALPLPSEENVKERLVLITQKMAQEEELQSQIALRRVDIARYIQERTNAAQALKTKIEKLRSDALSIQEDVFQSQQADASLGIQLDASVKTIERLSQQAAQCHTIIFEKCLDEAMPWLEQVADDSSLGLREMLEGALHRLPTNVEKNT